MRKQHPSFGQLLVAIRFVLLEEVPLDLGIDFSADSSTGSQCLLND